MNNNLLEKSIEIFAELITRQEIENVGENKRLYEEYCDNAEIYDTVNMLVKSLDLSIFQHGGGLYISPGVNNRIFSYTNEELKNKMSLKLNKELYLCYFIIYNIIIQFYTGASSYTYRDYTKQNDIVEAVNMAFTSISNGTDTIIADEIEEYSFKTIAMLWEQLAVAVSENTAQRADTSSKTGFVKKVFNFLVDEKLFLEENERYYPTKRFKALIENYFENNKSRVYEILNGGAEDAAY